MDDLYITLAIHTYDYAVGLRRILIENGIEVSLENVDLQNNTVSSGVRVRIKESDLPLALKIVENNMTYAPAEATMKLEGLEDKVLIPVDFSENSDLACKAGFAFASHLGVEVVLLHVYSSPYFDGNLSNTDSFTIEITDAKVRRDLEKSANVEMQRLANRVRRAIVAGGLPHVKFTTEVHEGVPEDVILQYVRNKPPMIVVMATRGAHKKASDMIGSVAAEVIDSCRLPVFTVPDNYTFGSFDDLSDVIYFCNISQQDLLAIDVFMRLMSGSNLNVHLIPVTDSAGSKLEGRLAALENYCKEHYPEHHFDSKIIAKNSFRSDIEKYINETDIRMLVVPNKKKNVFSRLFNPGIAHRIIFERDIPMMALPV